MNAFSSGFSRILWNMAVEGNVGREGPASMSLGSARQHVSTTVIVIIVVYRYFCVHESMGQRRSDLEEFLKIFMVAKRKCIYSTSKY